MNQLFSKGWFTDFVEEINRSSEYERVAEDWEGDILFVIRGDLNSTALRMGEDMLAHLDLYHGKCRSIDFPVSVNEVKSQYLIEGNVSEWESIMRGNNDLVSSILKGKIGVEGNMMKLMRYLPAAEQIVLCARRVTRL